MSSESPWNYKDKIIDIDIYDNVSYGKSFEYEIKIVGETPECCYLET